MTENNRIEEAKNRKASGRLNCAQSVACTYCDIAGTDEETMAAAAAAFGTGMGNLEGTCGALVGAGIILGMKTADRVKARAHMKNIMKRFKERNGSTTCRELKGVGTGRPLRACNDCVADAAEFLEMELNKIEGV